MKRELTLADVRPTDMLRLQEAARLAFPDGSVGISALRRELKRGRLTVWRIAGRNMTTLEEIGRMVERCRIVVAPPEPAHTSARSTEPQRGTREDGRLAQQAALLTVQRLKERFAAEAAEKKAKLEAEEKRRRAPFSLRPKALIVNRCYVTFENRVRKLIEIAGDQVRFRPRKGKQWGPPLAKSLVQFAEDVTAEVPCPRPRKQG